jgi:hypothetical protein
MSLKCYFSGNCVFFIQFSCCNRPIMVVLRLALWVLLLGTEVSATLNPFLVIILEFLKCFLVELMNFILSFRKNSYRQ